MFIGGSRPRGDSCPRAYSVVMRWRLGLWIVGVTVLTGAQHVSSVNETIDLVRTAIREKQKDDQIARSLHKWKLAESLDEHTIEELQSEGAGPKTVEELERLRQASADFPKPAEPPRFESPPVPSPAEQNRIVNEARAITRSRCPTLSPPSRSSGTRTNEAPGD